MSRDSEHVESLAEIMARHATANEDNVLALIREALRPQDIWVAGTLERLETRQVVSSWSVRNLLVHAFRAGAKYARDKDDGGAR